MKTKSLISHFLKRSKHLVIGSVLLLLAVSVNSNGYIHPAYEINKGAALHKNESQPRMFLITVVDSDDDSIGKRCEVDLEDVLYSFEDIADWLDVEMVEPKVIKGDQFSKAAVNDAIDNWLKYQEPGEDDIVVFYYSGHGFRYPGDASPYPRMWLKTAQDRNPKTTNLRMEEDIYNRIIKMGAGVNIIVSDCCNTTEAGDIANFDAVTVPTRQRVKHKREKPREEDADDDVDYGDKLFIPGHPLSILATAAEKGEFAGGKAETGGFFTNYFLDALDDCIYDNRLAPAWGNIFKYADDNASYWAKSAECPQAKHNEQGRCVQTVKYKMSTAE